MARIMPVGLSTVGAVRKRRRRRHSRHLRSNRRLHSPNSVAAANVNLSVKVQGDEIVATLSGTSYVVILREREKAPDRKLARRSYNAAAWAEAYAMGTFIVALVVLWLIATGEHLP